MKTEKTPMEGLVVLIPDVFCDDRGYFFESYQTERYRQAGIHAHFVQDNESSSVRGVIRGLHFQRPPHAQAKLVRVIRGTVLDVAVDCRPYSATFGQWYGVALSEENKKQFFIPAGFAHGFSVLSEKATFAYKCDAYYHPDAEDGILVDDPFLNIDWQIPFSEAIISEKDQKNKLFQEMNFNFNRQ